MLLDACLLSCYASGVKIRDKERSLQTPSWAIDLADKICRDKGIDERPEIIFKQARREWFGEQRRSSSGFANKFSISVMMGTDENDAKIVFLHEMAHWLAPAQEGHGPVFWDTAFDLYYNYGIDGAAAIRRERNYRMEARAAFNRSKYVTVDNHPAQTRIKRLNKRCSCPCHYQVVTA